MPRPISWQRPGDARTGHVRPEALADVVRLNLPARQRQGTDRTALAAGLAAAAVTAVVDAGCDTNVRSSEAAEACCRQEVNDNPAVTGDHQSMRDNPEYGRRPRGLIFGVRTNLAFRPAPPPVPADRRP